MSVLNQFKKVVLGEWRYKGVTNRLMNKHSWTNGAETVDVFHMNGSGHHAGFVVEVTGKNRDATLHLTNGFVHDIRQAMILADVYMRDDAQSPAAFMHSDRVNSNHGPGNAVRQDEWLEAHSHDYEFAIIDPQVGGS